MELLVIGTGGLAREFTNFFRSTIRVIGYSSVDDREFAEFKLSGKFFDSDVVPTDVGTRNCVVAVGDPFLRERLVQDYKKRGFVFPNVIHETVVSATDLQKLSSVGIVISPNCVLGSNIRMGNHIYMNFQVGVGHDAKIEDFVQINPGAQIGGNTVVNEGVLVGSGSSIRQNLKIGKQSRIGMGAVVLSSVNPGITVVGNPAKKMSFSS
ncbi:hypothetical protein N9M64_00230 [bacterium]|nr:hypothetical protein [bacterium]